MWPIKEQKIDICSNSRCRYGSLINTNPCGQCMSDLPNFLDDRKYFVTRNKTKKTDPMHPDDQVVYPCAVNISLFFFQILNALIFFVSVTNILPRLFLSCSLSEGFMLKKRTVTTHFYSFL